MESKLTIMVLCYGNHFELAKRCLSSIINNFNKEQYILRVGLNKVCDETKRYVLSLNEVDDVYISKINIHKTGMWRRMAKDICTNWCMWFDDDSYVVDKNALQNRLNIINAQNFDMAGHLFYMDGKYHGEYLPFKDYIKEQSWYDKKQIPCGVFEYEQSYNADGNDRRWFFLTGGNWIIKSNLLEKFNYPPLSIFKHLSNNNQLANDGDDVLICEILRQNNHKILDIGEMGIKINDGMRRGLMDIEEPKIFLNNF